MDKPAEATLSTFVTQLNDVDRTLLNLVNICADILCLLCRSLKGQEQLWLILNKIIIVFFIPNSLYLPSTFNGLGIADL